MRAFLRRAFDRHPVLIGTVGIVFKKQAVVVTAGSLSLASNIDIIKAIYCKSKGKTSSPVASLIVVS